MTLRTARRNSGLVDLSDPEVLKQFAGALGYAMVTAQNQQAGALIPQGTRYKETSLTATTVNIYGRYSIFDPCQPGDVFGLQVETHGLMNWLGWRTNKFYMRRVSFINWWGPAGMSEGTPGSGATAPCDDPPSWEYGTCGYELFHTSFYSIQGEALGPHQVVQDRCETTPRYRLNGTMITDDVEWQVNGIMNVINQQIKRGIVYGTHDNAYEMDGLTSIVRTGYADSRGYVCPDVDSIIVDWDNDNLDGLNNGLENFFDYLDEVVTEIEWRASAIGGINETDMALFTSRFMATCLLDSYACYTTCGVTDTNDITDQALRAQQRAARRDLNGGPLYDGNVAVGYIQLKSGRRLPIMVEDNIDISKPNANYVTDIWLLTRRIGNVDVLYGEYLDMRIFRNSIMKADPGASFRSDPIGRFVMKGKEDNFCHAVLMGTSPEIYLAAPWAQVRFENVGCARKRKPLVGDPYQPAYLPAGPTDALYPADGLFE